MAPMKRGKAVVVGTDLSDAADVAVKAADRWAKDLGLPLVVCHFLPETLRNNPLFPQLSQLQTEEMLDLETRAGDTVAERVAALTGRDPEGFDMVIGVGRADTGLLAEAERLHASLVVIGSRGATGIERVLLGNVAERVTRYAHCPVLVARTPVEGGKVLAASDFSDPSLPAVVAAHESAGRRSEQLVLLHSLDVFPAAVLGIGAPFGASWVTLPQNVVDDVRSVASGMAKDTLERANAKGEIKITDGPAAPAILRAAEELPADLIVIGTRGRTGLSRLVLGSVAESVVRHAPCSVLVVRTGA